MMLRSLYFNWLRDLISAHHENEELLAWLFEHFFYSTLPNDDNREEDGIKLRERYSEVNREGIFLSGPCTVLEMLIALSYRMDYILFDPSIGERPEKWFWLMIGNIKFGKNPSRNRDILTNFINRTYSPNGEGSLFPLNNPRRDMRHVEIWYQMMDYIEEKNL